MFSCLYEFQIFLNWATNTTQASHIRVLKVEIERQANKFKFAKWNLCVRGFGSTPNAKCTWFYFCQSLACHKNRFCFVFLCRLVVVAVDFRIFFEQNSFECAQVLFLWLFRIFRDLQSAVVSRITNHNKEIIIIIILFSVETQRASWIWVILWIHSTMTMIVRILLCLYIVVNSSNWPNHCYIYFTVNNCPE